MRISETYFGNNLVSQINQLQSQQFQLQNQVTTGLKITRPEDNPTAMQQVLNLQSRSATNAQYQTNIGLLQNTATTSATAMNSLQTVVEQANEIATQADGTASAQQLNSYATQIGGLIQQALDLANTQDSSGNYIFGGTANNAKPFTSTTDSSGNITSVTYQGNTSVAQVAISPTLTVSAQVPGANNTGTGPTGLFSDSRTGADLFNHLLTLQKDLASGNTAAVASSDLPNLNKDQDNVIYAIGANGVLQSTLQTVNSAAGQQGSNLGTEISNDSAANLPQAITQLAQTQTSLQAALQSGVMIMHMSILNYL
jgi:flagellar hook-associated protein 3 FlgL